MGEDDFLEMQYEDRNGGSVSTSDWLVDVEDDEEFDYGGVDKYQIDVCPECRGSDDGGHKMDCSQNRRHISA